MEHIFHEKQEGNLCAQHCLNALLQGPYFSAVDLASIARDLDQVEQSNLEPPNEVSSNAVGQSENYDDSGYFSVQVIQKALEFWGLTLVVAGSSHAATVIAHPTKEQAFICHYNNHWFTIRKLGHQWFNLNSMQKGALYISDTYLSLYLAQLANDGYYIFVVRGDLPQCEADQILSLCPYDPSSEKDVVDAANNKGAGVKNGGKKEHNWGNPAGTVYSSSAAKSATTSSLAQEAANSNSSTPADAETIRNKRLTRFMQTAPSSVNNFVTAATSAISNHFDGDFSCNDSRDSVTSASSVISLDNDSLHFGETYSSEEERQIQQAIRMSLEDTNH